MHAFQYIQSGFGPWKLVVVLGGFFLLITILIMIIKKYDVGSNGLTGAERKSLPREQREVLAMLRQNGGDMFQTEVADNIAGDFDYAVDILMGLEKKAKIKRCWDTNKGAYLVSVV